MESFATLLQLLRDIAPERNGSEVDSEVSFPNDILLRICNHIFSPPKEDSTQLVDILYAKAMQKYIDFKYYSFRNLGYFILRTTHVTVEKSLSKASHQQS